MGSDPAISGGDAQTHGAAPDLPGGARYGPPQPIGSGGMGRVDRVHDRHLGRDVARKTLSRLAPAMARRLLQEARLCARLDHPGIVPIFDLSTEADGTPWYTMRLIRGEALQSAMDAALAFDDRLRLVPRLLAAAQAVAHAHERGIVHRDLKPDNIMIGPHGETVVVDWGLGRLIGDAPEGSEASDPSTTSSDEGDRLTRTGAVVGTPLWMSPEQRRGEEADRRSDVWALGRILEVMLAGNPRAALPPPCPAELRTIVAKAKAELADQRYPEAGAFARDLEAWLSGRLVESHDYSAIEHLRRFVRTFAVPLAVAAVAILVLSAGLRVAFVRTARERDRAADAERQAQRVLARERATQAGAALVDGDPGRALMLADLALQTGHQPEAWLVRAAATASAPEILGVTLRDACRDPTFGERGDVVLCNSGAVPTVQRRGEAVRALPELAGADELLWLDGPRWAVGLVGGVVVRVDAAGLKTTHPVHLGRPGLRAGAAETEIAHLDQLSLRLLSEDGEVSIIDCPRPQSLLAFAAGPQGQWAATCSAGTVLLGNGPWWEPELWFPPGTALSAVAWAGAGDLIFGTLDGQLWRRSMADEHSTGPKQHARSPIRTLVPSPDAELVVVVAESGPARLVEPRSLSTIGSFDESCRRFQWSGARTLVAGGPQGVFDVTLGPEVRTSHLNLGAGVSAIDVDPNTGALAVATGEGEAWLFGPLGNPRFRTRVLRGVLKDIEFAPGGHELLTGGAEAGTATWLDARGAILRTKLASVAASRRQPLADGTVAQAIYAPRTERELGGGAVETLVEAASQHIDGDAAGTRVLLVGRDPWLSLWELEGEQLRTLDARQAGGPAAISSDGLWVFGHEGGVWRLYDADRALVHRSGTLEMDVTAVAVSPGGRRGAAGALDGTLVVFDLDLEREVGRARLHDGRISDLRFDGDRLWTGSWDGTVRAWNLDAWPAQPPATPTETRSGVSDPGP